MMTAAKKIFTALLPVFSVCCAFSGCVTVFSGGAVPFGHTLFLFPAAGAALYLFCRLGAPSWAAAVLSAAMLTGAVTEAALSGYGRLMLTLSAFLAFITLTAGALAAHLIYVSLKKASLPPARRCLCAAAALLILAAVLSPLSVFFGGPVKGAKSKRELDVWCSEYLSSGTYKATRFCYDWYNGVYYYEVTDKNGNGIGKLKHWAHEEKIFCSWENKVYKLNPNGKEK